MPEFRDYQKGELSMKDQKIKVRLEPYNPPYFPVKIHCEVGGISYNVPFTDETGAKSYVECRFANPVLIDVRAEISH